LLALVFRLGEGVLDDLMILARELHRPELVSDLRDLAGEAERQLVIAIVHRRAGIHADIESLVQCHEEWNGVRDFLVGDLPVVHLQHAGAALAESGAVVGELEHDGVLTWGESRGV
jgi:hypothetical protein